MELSADPEFVLPGVPVNTTTGREPELHCVPSRGRDVLGRWLGVGAVQVCYHGLRLEDALVTR